MPPTPASNYRRLALLLGGLAMFGPFSIDTIFPAFPAMGADLGADKLAMQQTISVYLVAYALMSVVHGPLSAAIGRRRVILAGLGVFKDRTSVVWGKSVSVRVDLGGRCIIKNKKETENKIRRDRKK